MAQDLNHFRFLELIEGESAMALTLKLKSIRMTYQLLKVWSDGKKHYAHINGMRPLSPADAKRIEEIK